MRVTKRLMCVVEMPELSHWPDRDKGVPFSAANSEVIKWLVSQPTVLEWLQYKMSRMKLMLYDKEKELWIGRNRADDVLKGIAKVIENDAVMAKPGRPLVLDTGRIIKLMVEHSPQRSSALQQLAKKKGGISKASFYRGMRKLKREGTIVKNDEKWYLAQSSSSTGGAEPARVTTCQEPLATD